MLHPVPHPDDLREIQELNHLFLILLQRRARRGADGLGLAGPIVRQIRDAQPTVIRGISTFPRALFALNLDCAGSVVEESTDEMRWARHALTLTVLLTAWHMSRQRGFQARMFLGLTVREAGILGTLPLSELYRVASMPGLLACAFPDARKLWASLLHHAASGLPPELHLVGLQPRLATGLGEDREPATRFESVSA